MCITNHAIRIHHADQRHATQLEEINFLPIAARHSMIRIGQTDKRKFMLAPIFPERVFTVRADGENLRATLCELSILITQARQLRAAIRSHEAAQKREHNWLAAIIRKAD